MEYYVMFLLLRPTNDFMFLIFTTKKIKGTGVKKFTWVELIIAMFVAIPCSGVLVEKSDLIVRTYSFCLMFSSTLITCS